MGQVFGREVPAPHIHADHREVTKYLVIVQGTEGPIARLLLSNREQVAELDANTEEITSMTRGITPSVGATSNEWDKSLSTHSAAERASAKVYALLP